MTLVRRVARPMLASTFLVSGIDALRHPAGRAEMASPLLSKLGPALGLPDDQETIVRANGAAMVLGGVMLATGRLPRVGAALLATSLVPTTLAGHRFWEESDPARRASAQTGFVKNVSMLGGLLIAAVDTAGRPGLAWRTRSATSRGSDQARSVAKSARREAKLASAVARREAKLKVLQAQSAMS